MASLLRRSEEYAKSLYPLESVHLLPVQELTAPTVRFLAARDHADGQLLGCGAVILQPDRSAEIKRMFVEPSARRRGVGSALLQALEGEAVSAHAVVVRLETGTRQPEAIALYRSAGFLVRPPFGDYPDDPLSVFMEKWLDERE